MKNHFSAVSKLVAAAVCALSLGSCSRAEYAMLPKGASYHGVARAATPVPATPAAARAQAPVAPSAPVAAPATAAAPAARLAPAAAVATAPAAAKVPAATPAANETLAATPAAVATAPAAAPAKLNLLQRVALSKVSKKLEKAYHKTAFTRHENTANTARLDGKLRQGLILLLVGLLVGIVGGAVGGTIGNVIGLLGLILAIIGIVLIILYLLDEL